jgi:hypothetical protein
MSDILNQVTPLSRGIIWLRKADSVLNSEHYKWIDYLLDGLLTASHEASSETSNCLLVGKNFGKDFYVFISQRLVEKELVSFFDLVGPSLGNEEDLLILDENESFAALNKLTPKEIQHKFRVIS